jgi:hypothetical protein
MDENAWLAERFEEHKAACYLPALERVLPEGTVYQLWLVGRAGARSVATVTPVAGVRCASTCIRRAAWAAPRPSRSQSSPWGAVMRRAGRGCWRVGCAEAAAIRARTALASRG